MTLTLRQSRMTDAAAISRILETLAERGQRSLPTSEDFVRTTYIRSRDLCASTLACVDGVPTGLQILLQAGPDNTYGAPAGWGIIGTHIHPDAHRQGIGRALFKSTLSAARHSGLAKIEAAIGAKNAAALAYYAAIGFEPYARTGQTLRHVYRL